MGYQPSDHFCLAGKRGYMERCVPFLHSDTHTHTHTETHTHTHTDTHTHCDAAFHRRVFTASTATNLHLWHFNHHFNHHHYCTLPHINLNWFNLAGVCRSRWVHSSR